MSEKEDTPEVILFNKSMWNHSDTIWITVLLKKRKNTL